MDDADLRPPRPTGRDDALRKVAQLEEMVARTHERAAEMYETWLEQRSDTPTDPLRNRARRHREQAVAVRSFRRLAVRSLQGFETRVATGASTSGKARHLAVLAGLEYLRDLLDRRIAEVVATGRQEGASWTEIGSALGVTRQTAHERYRHRSAQLSGGPDARSRPVGQV